MQIQLYLRYVKSKGGSSQPANPILPIQAQKVRRMIQS